MGAWFERQVAAALDRWLSRRPETVHVFHDLTRLDTVNGTSGRRLNLGTSNVDHLVLTGAGWIMIDAKRIGRGRLVVERGRGMLITPEGHRRPQPWMDDGRANSRAGCMFDLAKNMGGEMVWVVPDEVDYSALAHQPPRCVRKRGYILTLAELAAGELEAIRELRPPYRAADPVHVARLKEHINVP